MYKRSHLKSESCLDLALILRTWRMNTLLQVDIIKSDLWTLIIMQVVPIRLSNVLFSHCKNLGDQRERFWISNVGKKFFPPTFIFGRTGLLEAEVLLTNSCFTCSQNFLKNFKFYFNPQKQFPTRSLNWSLGTNHCNGVHTRSTPLPASNSN